MSRELPQRTVYLAGPITGLTHNEARYGWRERFSKLMPAHIHCNSPMRGKELLKEFGVLSSGAGYPEEALLSSSWITTRDLNDVKTSDAVVTCFLESGGRLSGGTFMEEGFAYSRQVPILAIGAEDDPNIQHLMARHVVGARVDTLEEAAFMICHLLTPGL